MLANDRNNDTWYAESSAQSAEALPIHQEGVYPGLLLKGRYLIERELGRGGIGVVYLGRDQQLLSKPVVIKFLLESSAEKIWFKKKFRQEIEALARLDHPAVIGILDAGETVDGKLFLVMQFVQGVNLREVLNSQKIPFNRVAEIMRQIGQAISAAHDKGIHHRDLKPDNDKVTTSVPTLAGCRLLAMGSTDWESPTAHLGILLEGPPKAPGNLISGNGCCDTPRLAFANLYIFDASANIVQGNLIGTDANGSQVPNVSSVVTQAIESRTANTTTNAIAAFPTRTGVIIADPDGPTSNNTVGGTTAGARNVISGHFIGVEIVNTGSSGNQVQGNFIGTDVNGNVAVGNDVGVRIAESPDTTIGGASIGARNVISGNTSEGIVIGFGQVSSLGSGQITATSFIGQKGASVQGNYIGPDASGIGELPNGGDGIFVETHSLINTIADNVIAFNEGNGIAIPNSTANGTVPGFSIAISSNSISSNTGLGIDLGGDNAVTANDQLDGDAGANFLQNFPVLTSAISSSGMITVTGTFNSEPLRSYKLEFFTGAGCSAMNQVLGSAKVLGSNSVTTDASGNASFSFSFTIPPGPHDRVNATATDPDGNTSEFSQCMAVTGS